MHTLSFLPPSLLPVPSSWQVAKEQLMAKGGTLLAAMGLDAVLSAEERKKVADNLKQSGDEDHEVRGGSLPPTVGVR